MTTACAPAALSTIVLLIGLAAFYVGVLAWLQAREANRDANERLDFAYEIFNRAHGQTPWADDTLAARER